MDLLRFITAGSVDDGKSTLIGRLLFDTHSIKLDQLEMVKRLTKSGEEVDLSLLVDGLRAEREQGITIDVAYKYFQTEKKKFIIADAPGHVQYTRNMITGASNCDCIIILIDANQGVVEQTKRHSLIASLLKIPHVVVAINKMDRVNYSRDVFDRIVKDYNAIAKELMIQELTFIPISALKGDNVVLPSKNMSWYRERTLLDHLESIHVVDDLNFTLSRMPVQYVMRCDQKERGYAGKVVSGEFFQDQTVVLLPDGIRTQIKKIEIYGRGVSKAVASQSVIIYLNDDIDISRGDVIVAESNMPKLSNEIEATFCWTDKTPLSLGKKYLMQRGSCLVKAVVKEIEYKLDVNTLKKHYDVNAAHLNDVVRVKLQTNSPLVYDSFDTLRWHGTAILIDETSNHTVAGCLLH